jgi:hippurate hydrolase
MHACGHDGHTAMLLGAARHLAATRGFAGAVVLLFQPAEEVGGQASGAALLVAEGILDQLGVERVFGLHNAPQLPLGTFAIREGLAMAAVDNLGLTIRGRGGHAAAPHLARDPIRAGVALAGELQALIAREVDPLDSAVLSLTVFQAGTAENVIPDTARLAGTIRTLREATRAFLLRRLDEIARGLAAATGVAVEVTLDRGYPALVNHPAETAMVAAAARELVGEAGVVTGIPPVMAGEDFAILLRARPGAFVFMGTGAGDADAPGLHEPGFDFNDAALPTGAAFWVELVGRLLPAG